LIRWEWFGSWRSSERLHRWNESAIKEKQKMTELEGHEDSGNFRYELQRKYSEEQREIQLKGRIWRL